MIHNALTSFTNSKSAIIGDGLIARSFKNSQITCSDCIIFASGISNSNINSEIDIRREALLLSKYINIANENNLILVYFSSCSIYERVQRKYALHKLNMEQQISDTAKKFLILRLPIVVGANGNNNQLINFIYNNIKEDKEFNVYENIYRQLIHSRDLPKITNFLINDRIIKNKIIDIGYNNSIKILDIVNYFENLLKKKAYYKLTINTDYEYDLDYTYFLNQIKGCDFIENLLVNPYNILKENYNIFACD